MKNRVLLKSALLLLLLAAGQLVDAFENDDLVFDQDGRQWSVEVPEIEKREELGLFHRIKRGIWDLFSTADTTNAPSVDEVTDNTEESPIDIQEDAERTTNRSNGNAVKDDAEEALGRISRGSEEERNEIKEHDDNNGNNNKKKNNNGHNEVGNAAEGRRRIHASYSNSDDEDLAGSGETEGSATDAEVHHPITESPNVERKPRFYRITLTVGEPYRREFSDRSSREYKELSGNLTEAIEQLYARHFPEYYHFANVVKISPTSDAFISQVTLDIGSTFTDEHEVQTILEQQLEYHSLGTIQVRPEGFTFRHFQADGEVPPECDQSTELTCRDGKCVPLESRCNGINDCNDGSDEIDCEIATTRCKLGEFACDVRRCILESQRCNFVEDCQDGSDEHDCVYPACTANQFKCRNEECIDNSKHCDGIPDCRDGSDEYSCPRCRADEFECAIGTCVSKSARCDGRVDCLDQSDEHDCNVTTCSADQFRCLDGTCLSIDKRCNGIPDCRNREDESQCECPVGKLPCDNGVCIDQKFFCDNNFDCLDRSDERNCPDTGEPGKISPEECEENEFTCHDGSCISRSAMCDGRADCPQSEDERNCGRGGCAQDQFQCRNGDCIRSDQRCDGYMNCDDGSDEDCETTTTPTPEIPGRYPPTPTRCAVGQFQCISDETCVPESAICNGIPECRDASDEDNCEYPEECATDQWRCSGGGCIYPQQVCDRTVDCPFDDSDEVGCINYTRPGERNETRGCAANEWTCENGECIPIILRCDKRIDCPTDMSDESDCSYDTKHPEPPTGLNLKTYPSEQVIKENPAKEGREVVFQCRDEGPIRAKVRWVRENNLPLPPGSRDLDGRLEIPNIQLKHAGVYICEAVGFPPSTPGRQLSVFLTVEKLEEPLTRPPHVCQYDEATCSNGDCIPKSSVCNGKFDCTDGSDEMRCSPHGCEPNQFRCNNKQCVSKFWRCDGEKDCFDGSDEENCAPPPPGSQCTYSEFACRSHGQCIPKIYHCDMERDCLDGSDELGCTPVYIVKPPPPMVVLKPGDLMTLTCTAIGVPMPEINWRRNWGHVPPKCSSTSINGTGTLMCPDVQVEDQGAYSCEALYLSGFVFAVPDTILVVESKDICPKGMFNAEAKSLEECISCFCFGVATECRSANLFTYEIPPPNQRHKLVSVETSPVIAIRTDFTNQISSLKSDSPNSLHIYDPYSNDLDAYNNVYYALSENYHGNQLKSYGGFLKYNIRYSGDGQPNNAPAVIITGNNYTLVYKGQQIPPHYETQESVRFFYGEWYKRIGRDEVIASREEIMMTLANVDNILIKAKYEDSPQLDVHISNVIMDTADARNTGLGSASFVEECKCPTGYSGLSCENCAPGFLRRESGPWLGQCYRDEPTCGPGYYGDPSRNIPCQICPCPLTNPSNQFSRTCHLGSDGQPTCDCPPGYVGRRCERCDVGYQGNPLKAGDMCVPVSQCDPNGSISTVPDSSGRCHCKQYATGLTCNQCKANTFNLASTNQFGCISCFCMGITNKCVSSNWYRSEIHVSFTNSIRDFSLVESQTSDATPIVEDIRLDTINREIVYNDFPNRGNNDVYYWQLPSIFLGDRVTSYGGKLKYTVRYVPSPGGQSSRNNAADVELISANGINLLYYSRESPQPNVQQSFTVPLLEQYWQRTDGTEADREHLLMALADIRAIRIKATYTTHTDEAALSSVSLDTAEKYNTGRPRAVEVEECTCPVGYRGLSCEDCDVGYTRGIGGLYLGICEPCNCHGHSNQCDPDTGACENCAHHTTGESCNLCEHGYQGDATRGTPYDCMNRNDTPVSPCRCNEAGSRSTMCIGNRCECKRNVEGPECNRCRPSTFGLSAKNIDGCNMCYCSGVTDQCHESSLYVQQIPMSIYDSHHGFTLTDSTRREVIDEGFELNVAMNEIGYRYPDGRNRRLFWSLPPVFTGNKVKSYGGSLILTQHITAFPGAQSYRDQDVLLIGNGITLFWTNPITIEPDVPLTYSVPLRETEWKRLSLDGPRSASRSDLMTALSSLEAILVRASHSEQMMATYISDISMDTAVETVTEYGRATQIEACRCPPGYAGTSCETCARGYYRDINDRSVSILGVCSPCPCNKNEESCEMSRSGQITCHCLPKYTGKYCEYDVDYPVTNSPPRNETITPPRIEVFVQEPQLQIVQTGNTVTYHCNGRSLDNQVPLRIHWEKEGGQLPADRSVDDTHGLLIIRDVKVSDSGVYVCQVSDGINVGIKKVTLTVGGTEEPRVTITPSYMDVIEGEPVEFRCESNGSPPPQIDWIRVHGSMSPEATIFNGVLRLPAAAKSDAAEYKCIARNNIGMDEKTAILYVKDNPNKPPRQGLPPIISPSEWVGTTSEVVRLACTPSQHNANVTWIRSGGLPLPYTATQRDGVLTITNPTVSDSGIYVCTAVSYQGTETSNSVKVTIVPRREIKVKPERQTISQGTSTELRCFVSGEPGLQVKWIKHVGIMGPNIQQVGDSLRIVNAQVSDRGIYICRVVSSTGTYEATAMLEVEPREAPVLELYPQDTQTAILGGSASVQCRAVAGIPTPDIYWSREDGRPFPPNVEQLPGGLLRLTNISMSDGVSYVCTARNEAGTSTVVAHIEVQSIPKINIEPSSGILQVKRGDRVRLVCSAVGNPPPNVFWRKHTTSLYSSVNREFMQDRSLSAVYEIFSVSPDDEGTYTCCGSNSVGIAEEQVQIRIQEEDDYPPCRGDMPCNSNSTDPNNNSNQGGVVIPEDFLRIPNGGKVEMRCQVFGPYGNHIYLDWKRSDHRSLPKDSTVHNGILSIPAVDKSAAGEYICLGLDRAGTVLFKARSHLEIISPPRIELNPTRQTVGPGKNPSVTCSATGDEPLRIEWEAIGSSLPPSVTQDRGVLQFHGITYSDAGKYVCKATNEAGTAEAVAEVLVNEHSYDTVDVRATQKDVTTYAGSSVRLRCEVREHARIHWSREGQPLPPNSRIHEDYLELTQVRTEDSGRYICQIRNAHGVSSDYINLSVSSAVLPTLSIEASQDLVNIGDTIDIRCSCTGIQNPQYFWSRPNHPSLPPNAEQYDNVLRLTSIGLNDSGIYRCTVVTPKGNFDEDFNLIVHGGHNDAPEIETIQASYGSNPEMNCRVNLEPPIKFHWSKLGGELSHNVKAFENKLQFSSVTAEDAGTYICIARKDNENIEIPTVLIVTGVVPNFNQAPESYIVLPPLPDSYLKFTVEVSFKPENYNGIILYNVESKHNTGDFIVLSLVNGYPQFSFDFGSGRAIIQADKPVTLSQWHTIKIQRHNKEGMMIVDGKEHYKGMTSGKRQGLDLHEPLYVGGIPRSSVIHKDIQMTDGFVGCISRLIINRRQIDLIGNQTNSVGITNCETCAENPCNNGGVCQEAATKNGYTCLCRVGFSGDHCDFFGQSCYPGVCGEGTCVPKENGFDCYCPYGRTGSRCERTKRLSQPAFNDDKAFIAHETPKALRRERKSSSTTHNRSQLRYAQLRNIRSRAHHNNNLHHTKH